MYELIQVETADQLAQFCAYEPLLNTEAVKRAAPDAQWMVIDENGQVSARCSLWWVGTPPYEPHHLGVIGHYASHVTDAAISLLDHVCAALSQQGCTLAVGPMNGNTWRPHRFVTEWGTEPPFFLEPSNPPEWPAQFRLNGFGVLGRYTSRVITDLTATHPRLAKLTHRLTAHGITIRHADIDTFDEELDRFYDLTLASFHENFLYTPVEREHFKAQYRPMLPYIQPEMVLVAEKNDTPIGFMVAVPDILQKQRQQKIDTAILKTVGVLPAYRTLGLGTVMMYQCHHAAHNLGYRRILHALMYEGSDSQKISSRVESESIREYALFARKL